MFSINYFKGFSVMRTNNLEETSMIICNMVYKLVGGLKAGKNSFYNNDLQTQIQHLSLKSVNDSSCEDTKEPTEKEYCSVVKKVKKENITPENIGEIMLCQIPGISSVTAIAIMKKYSTILNLIAELQENPNCLNDIKRQT